MDGGARSKQQWAEVRREREGRNKGKKVQVEACMYKVYNIQGSRKSYMVYGIVGIVKHGEREGIAG